MKYNFLFLINLLILQSLHFVAFSQKNPVELGEVQWLRDFDEAVSKAQLEKKPVFILFQEVPGCATCQRYGKAVMSHPFIVEAIETYFIPVAIYNNKGGKDAEVLRYYREPTWNNPVVRIVSSDKKNLVPRLSGNYSSLGVLQTIITAMDQIGLAVPQYLELFEEELISKALETEKVTFSMYCFWTGEGNFGQIPGVVSTKSGFMDSREVVQVEYSPEVISFKKLLEKALREDMFDHVYTHNDKQKRVAQSLLEGKQIHSRSTFRADHQPKYYLSRTQYRSVPMTPLQASRVNSTIGKGKSPDFLLSPRQLAILDPSGTNAKKVRKENRIDKDFQSSWWKINGNGKSTE